MEQPPPDEGGPTGPPPHTGADPTAPRPDAPGHPPAPPGHPPPDRTAPPGAEPPSQEPPETGAGSPPQEPREPTVVDEGFLETALGVITSPVATLRAVTHQPKVGWAIWLTLGIGLLTAVAGTVQLGADPAMDEFIREIPELAEFTDIQRTLTPVAIISGPFLTLLWITIVAAVLQGTSSLLGGDGRFRGMFVGVAFANVPSAFGVLTSLLTLALGLVGSILGSMISFGLFIWVVILGAIAVRENHRFTTGRAAAAVLIPIGVVFVLGILLVILVFALLFAAFGG
jgi:hypothetical protein